MVHESQSEFREEEIDETYCGKSNNRSSLNIQIQTIKEIKTNGFIQKLKDDSQKGDYAKKLSYSTPL